MSKKSLQKQADRAENIADQIVDDVLKETLRDAATEYRKKANDEDRHSTEEALSVESPTGPAPGEDVPMFALFEGETQLGGTFTTEKEVWEAALIEGLVTDVPVADEAGGQILPRNYHVKRVQNSYDPRPDWKPGE